MQELFLHPTLAKLSRNLIRLLKLNGNEFMNGAPSHVAFGGRPLISPNSSGDTGVAASLVLHGTPPFHVYYQIQRDREPARERVKTFHDSRGEMTLQPSQSGHYVYSFSHLSDANYNKVELRGPTIDQIVHPLASASFAGSSGRDRMVINSCSENSVEVEVNLGVSIEAGFF